MKAYGGVDVWIHIFMTSALVGGEWSASHPGRFTPDKHWIGGWVGPRTGLDDVERRKISPVTGLELRSLGLPARGQSIYRLHYLGPSALLGIFTKIILYLYNENLIFFKLLYISRNIDKFYISVHTVVFSTDKLLIH
jgi:hypothetical protein